MVCLLIADRIKLEGKCRMPSKNGAWLEKLAAIAQIISLPFAILSVLLIVYPELLKGLHLSPIIPALALVALLILFFGLAFVARWSRVQALRRQRQAHNLVQQASTDRIAVGVDEHVRGLKLEENFVEPRLQRTGKISASTSAPEEWSMIRVLRDAVLAEQAGVVLWGMAGSGKTASAKWLAHQIALSEDRETWQFLQRRAAVDTAKQNTKQRRILDWRRRGLQWLGLELSEYDLHYPYVFYIELQRGDF